MSDAAPVHGAPVAEMSTPAPAGPLLSETITTTTTTTTTTVTERKFAPLPLPDPKRPRTLLGYFGELRAGPSTSGGKTAPAAEEKEASLALAATPLTRGCAREKGQIFRTADGVYKRWVEGARDVVPTLCSGRQSNIGNLAGS